MADYSVALGVRPPQIDIGGAMQLAGSLQNNQLQQQNMLHGQRIAEERLKMAKDQQAMVQAAAAERLAAERGQRNALSEYNQANAAGDENALSKLSSYPDLQSKILGVRSQMDEAQRARFDRGLINNARRAQYVAGLQGEQKSQAWLDVLAEARDAGDITPEMHQQYASQQPNDLLLHNVISQAVPIQQLYQQNAPTAKMLELEAAGIEQGTPEYREQIAPAPLPKYEKFNGRLLKIVPGQDPIDVTPSGSGSMADAGKLGQGERWRMKDGQLELDASGRPIAEPIPGSSKEAVSSETAARLGLARKFIDESQSIRSDIEKGKMSGIDYYLNRGDAGDLYRRIEDGSEALVRNLTGAGMNENEAKTYAARFLPGNFDGNETVLKKFDNLVKNLQAVQQRVQIGRGIASIDDLEIPTKDQSRIPQGLAPGSEVDDAGLADLPEGSVVKDERGNRFEKRGGQLVPVQ